MPHEPAANELSIVTDHLRDGPKPLLPTSGVKDHNWVPSRRDQAHTVVTRRVRLLSAEAVPAIAITTDPHA
ncbi:hypothetical protein GCM10010211_10800 [Streptomyces albospinus]|uniref:Uncharacterized protein n=1 Tax=Streptomyces albospinus TaxID=285515 RepID=A0ABQ2US19_9ACTN|nr:hypothetical protein GCM10010211_10800 [Streptomyces albospinus]